MIDRFRVLVEGLDHVEAVAWSPRGTILAGGEAGQVYEVGLDGAVSEIAQTGGTVLGLCSDAAGRIYLCDVGRGEVLRVDPVDGGIEVVSTGTAEEPFRVPNYLTFDANGVLYVTDSGDWSNPNGLIYRVTKEGTEVWSRAASYYTNGCCMDPTGSALVVVESTLPGVSRISIAEDGSAGNREVLATMPGAVPDGVAFGADGSIYVSCWRPDRVYRINPDGRVDIVIDDPYGITVFGPTNLAFVGNDLEQIVLSSVGSNQIAIGSIDASGLPINYPDVE